MEQVALALSVISAIIGITFVIAHINTIDKRISKFAKKDDLIESFRSLERKTEVLEVIPQVRELLVLRGQDPDGYGISYDYKGVILPNSLTLCGECYTPQEIRLMLKTTKEACCKKKSTKKTKNV